MKTTEKFVERPDFRHMSDSEKKTYITYYLENVFKQRHPIKTKIPFHLRDDTEQELFLDLWVNIDKYKPELGTYDTYAYYRSKAVIKKILMKHKKSQRNVPIEEGKIDQSVFYSSDDRHFEWHDIIKHIPKRYRKLVEMRFRENLPVSTIALKLGMSQLRVYQILQSLKKYAQYIDLEDIVG